MLVANTDHETILLLSETLQLLEGCWKVSPFQARANRAIYPRYSIHAPLVSVPCLPQRPSPSGFTFQILPYRTSICKPQAVDSPPLALHLRTPGIRALPRTVSFPFVFHIPGLAEPRIQL